MQKKYLCENVFLQPALHNSFEFSVEMYSNTVISNMSPEELYDEGFG